MRKKYITRNAVPPILPSPIMRSNGTVSTGKTAMLIAPRVSVKRISSRPPSAPPSELIEVVYAAVDRLNPIAWRMVGPQETLKKIAIEAAM